MGTLFTFWCTLSCVESGAPHVRPAGNFNHSLDVLKVEFIDWVNIHTPLRHVRTRCDVLLITNNTKAGTNNIVTRCKKESHRTGHPRWTASRDALRLIHREGNNRPKAILDVVRVAVTSSVLQAVISC